jgi:hypothetical protein
MKTVLMALALGMASSAFAQEVTLSDFNNWKLTDIAAKGYKKEALFSKMNRDLIKVGASICSNRALVWAYDFKRNQNIDAGKLFLFYTKKTGEVGQKTWWYHVTPIINEKGSIFAMDAGFPGSIKAPITPKEWLKKFAGSSDCKEIKSGENDLIERMFYGYVFPGTTSHGTYDCYYSMTPGGYWTPSSVAMGLLGVDENGKPVQYIRDEINQEEVYAACVEAVTGPLGRVLGGGKKRCAKYLGMEIPL